MPTKKPGLEPGFLHSISGCRLERGEHRVEEVRLGTGRRIGAGLDGIAVGIVQFLCTLGQDGHGLARYVGEPAIDHDTAGNAAILVDLDNAAGQIGQQRRMPWQDTNYFL